MTKQLPAEVAWLESRFFVILEPCAVFETEQRPYVLQTWYID